MRKKIVPGFDKAEMFQVAGKRKDGGGVSDEISALIAKTKTAAKSHK